MPENYLISKIIMTINNFGMAYYCLDESVSEECGQRIVGKLNQMGAAAEFFNDGDRNIIYAFIPKKEGSRVQNDTPYTN